MTFVTLRAVGDSLGFELPADILARLDLKAGDSLAVSQSENGEVRLTRVAAHDRQMRLTREGMSAYREALAELAK